MGRLDRSERRWDARREPTHHDGSRPTLDRRRDSAGDREAGAGDRRVGVLPSLQRSRGNQAVGGLLAGEDVAAWDAFITGSPPASGPGSRADPLVAGEGGVLRVEQMRPDAYYRSPVNPENPVLVWTDGSTLHFGPSQGQVEAGRMEPQPEPTLSIPEGYTVEAIHWDRRHMLVTGGGALLVSATTPAGEEFRVAVSSRLEQHSYMPSQHLEETAASHVTRENAEFVQVSRSSVPVGFSGASAPGPIHQVTFADGFYRYRATGGSNDLYVGQDAPEAYLVEQATGDIVKRFDASAVTSLSVEPTGVAHIERRGGTGDNPVTTRIDLRASPASVTTTPGHASTDGGYDEARAELEAADVRIQEQGLRFTVAELETIADMVHRGRRVLADFRELEHGQNAVEPLLEVKKSPGADAAYGNAERGDGTPTLRIKEPFESTTPRRRSTVRHEMTHVLMGATDAVRKAKMSPRERANLEGAMRFEARRGRRKAQAGLLRSTEYGRGDEVPDPDAPLLWRSHVGEHPELAAIWVELLRRYTFIPDPEGTAEFRGVSLADESRYSGASDVPSGHPADSVSEFVASFVACATVFTDQFREAVLAAEAAGNARGGRGGSYVRDLYRRTWEIIDSVYVPLGPNPF